MRTITKTPEGYKIYKCWTQMKCRHDVCPEWERFEPFYEWASAHGGGNAEMALRIKDSGKPCGPDNCAFYARSTSRKLKSEEHESIRRWNKTVNRIRERCGMPLFDFDDDDGSSGLLDE